jgi:hypothetical protein
MNTKSILSNFIAVTLAVIASLSLNQVKMIYNTPWLCKVIIAAILFLFIKLIFSLIISSNGSEA